MVNVIDAMARVIGGTVMALIAAYLAYRLGRFMFFLCVILWMRYKLRRNYPRRQLPSMWPSFLKEGWKL
jgi:hypothetical protein